MPRNTWRAFLVADKSPISLIDHERPILNECKRLFSIPMAVKQGNQRTIFNRKAFP
jgi:hypothetical protein